MLLSEILDDITTRIADDSLTDDILTNWVNMTQRDIQGRANWPFLKTSATITCTAGTDEYDLPSNFARMMDVTQATTPAKLAYTEPHNIDRLYPDNADNTGDPLYYTIMRYPQTAISAQPQGKIKVYPVPTASTILSCKYYQNIVALSADYNISMIPERYHEALILGPYYRGLRANDDFDQAREIKAEYEIMIRQMKSDLLTPATGPRTIMQDGRYSDEITSDWTDKDWYLSL